jgi:endonuclease/exonuclease/phosphatase family metal-dependent hydrolase
MTLFNCIRSVSLLKLLFLLLISFELYAKSFSVASYNVENLFDVHYDKTEYKEYIPNKTNWNQHTFEVKLNNIAQVINDINSDIIALQEIESKKALEHLIQKTPQYAYYDFIKNPKSSIGLALLSKYPIVHSSFISIHSNDRFSRPIQKVKIEIEPHKQLIIFNNHWRSKKAAESKRIEYAMSLKKYVEQLPKNSDYIILGDLNSNYNEYETFKHNEKLNDSYNITGINQVLNTTIEQKFVTKKNILKQSALAHYNLWLELPYHKRFSYFFRNHPNTPDNIIVSKGLFDDKNIAYKDGSFKVFTPSYLVQNNFIKRWEVKNGFHQKKGFSDHLPIMASFTTKPYITIKQNSTASMNTFDYLYTIEDIQTPLIFKDVMVLYKDKNSAILKQKNQRAVFAYNCAKALEVGKSYDIEVQNIKTHFGLKEITHLKILQKKEPIKSIQSHYLNASKIDVFDIKYQNEIITNLKGTYKNNYLYFEHQGKKEKIRLYSKDKSVLPKNGQKVTIISAHLGFYGSNVQIILYKRSDIRVN